MSHYLRQPVLQLGRSTPDFHRPGKVLGLPLDDPYISRKPFQLEILKDGVHFHLQGNSTQVVVDGRLLKDHAFFPIQELERGLVIELSNRVALLFQMAPELIESTNNLGMIGHSEGIQKVRSEILQVADLTVPVLIRGETGVGKEKVARAIFENGCRSRQAFVGVNLAAIPHSLAASELFGATKGAFTGAVQRQTGYFQSAHNGTLFLDEVGEASPEIQAMLLRVLETGEIFPIGRQMPVSVDVRILAATDAHLELAAKEGQFKAPLLHRLAAYELRIPGLRHRREDICRLFAHFAREELGQTRPHSTDPMAPPWFPTKLASKLCRYDWPGNIRQLRNATRQLVIANRHRHTLRLTESIGSWLGISDNANPSISKGWRSAVAADGNASTKQRLKPREVTQEALLQALLQAQWQIKKAADLLQIARPSLYRLLDRFAGSRDASQLDGEQLSQCHAACGGDLGAMARRLMVSPPELEKALKHNPSLS